MKKKILAVLLVAAMTGTMMLGCGKKEGTPKKSEKKTEKESSDDLVGISVPKAITGWTAAVQYYAEKAAEEEGLNYISTAADNGSPEAGLAAMTDVLTANPEIDAIYSADDEVSVGIYQAIQEAGRTDIKVVTGGGGANAYFKLMDQTDIWLCSQTYAPNMIIECVKMAKGILEGETYDSVITIPTENVDRDNVEQWKKDNMVDEKAPY